MASRIQSPDIWILQSPEDDSVEVGENDRGSVGGLSDDNEANESPVLKEAKGGVQCPRTSNL